MALAGRPDHAKLVYEVVWGATQYLKTSEKTENSQSNETSLQKEAVNFLMSAFCANLVTTNPFWMEIKIIICLTYTYVVPESGMPTAITMLKASWKKNMKKNSMKRRELSTLQHKWRETILSVTATEKCHPNSAGHRQQCKDTTYNLLLSFWHKNLQARFSQGESLWLGALFYLLLFVRNFFFSKSTSSWRILTSTSHDPTQKNCHRHCARFFTSQRTAPLAPCHFFSKFRFWPSSKANASLPTAMDKMHSMDSLLWATDTAKSKKKGSRNVHPAPKMRAKIKQKKTHTCVAVVALNASKKARTNFDFGGWFFDRWCLSSLVLFPSAIYSCQGDLETCFTCLHQSKASQKAHV